MSRPRRALRAAVLGLSLAGAAAGCGGSGRGGQHAAPGVTSSTAPLVQPGGGSDGPDVRSGPIGIPTTTTPRQVATPTTLISPQLEVAGATAVLDPGPCILEIVLKTDTVGFAHDSATLSDAGVALVSGVAASIRTSTHAVIVGYTSSEGPRAYNVGLSLRRAEAVRAVVGPLVPGIVLDVGGRGPDDPVASNATAEGRSANRRVVIQAKIKRPEC